MAALTADAWTSAHSGSPLHTCIPPRSVARCDIISLMKIISSNCLPVVGKRMGARHHLAHVFGAVIAMIVLNLAPSIAFAHPEHGYAGQVSHHHEVHSQTTDAALRTETTSRAELKLADAFRPQSSDISGCQSRGCCSGAPCPICSAAAISDLYEIAPPHLSAILIFLNSRPDDTSESDGLRRPPKSFA